MTNTSSLFKRSIHLAFSIIAGISTIAGLLGYTIRDTYPHHQWWEYCLLILTIALILTGILYATIYVFQNYRKHKPYETTINGKSVKILIGNIFDKPDWKVIPFNERYDTQVDDIIISHSSLNGQMIDNYVNDLSELNEIIKTATKDNSPYKSSLINGYNTYPLGRIIPYKNFLMLSFSHFDSQNRAYIEFGEYEQLLFRLWSELRRVYAGKTVSIPLIGSGITTIHGIAEKNYTELLKCILCTLRSSKFQPTNGINIILPQDVINQIDMNSIRKDF